MGRKRAERATFILLALALLFVLCAPLAAQAQQVGKVWRVGFLSYRGCGVSVDPAGAFRQRLRELGYVEGQNLVIECRDAPGQIDRFPDLARELVRLKADVLVAESTPAGLAAKQATGTVPIVMVGVADPVTSGLASSLARPGGNVTGPSFFPGEVGAKVLEMLKQVAPHVSRVTTLRDPANPGQMLMNEVIDRATSGLGMKVQRIGVRGSADLPVALAAVLEQGAHALLVYPLPIVRTDIQQISEFGLKHKLPTATNVKEYAEQGILLFYGPQLADQYRLAGVYIDKILRGAKPADLPVEQPTKFELVINLKTAKALGLTIPPSLLLRADEVIE